MVWNRTVCFTVHSAYHYEWQHQFNSRSLPAATGPSMPNHVWNILWKLKVPCKKKKKSWRALHGLIPMKSILANRHIRNDAQCPVLSSRCRRHLPSSVQLWPGSGDVASDGNLSYYLRCMPIGPIWIRCLGVPSSDAKFKPATYVQH